MQSRPLHSGNGESQLKTGTLNSIVRYHSYIAVGLHDAE
jgi:hypothetical protein